MFKIEAYVEDKRVGDALRALAGIVRGQPKITPVVNIEEPEPKLKAASNGSLLGMFEQHLNKSGVSKLTPHDIQDWLKRNGHSSQSSSYLAKVATRAKLLRRSGKSSKTVYTVRQPHG